MDIDFIKPERGDITKKDCRHPAAYRLTHVDSGKIYIGSTVDLYGRVHEHRGDLIKGNHHNENLQKVFDTGGELRLEYVRTSTKEEALDIEQRLLDLSKGSDDLLNTATDARRSGFGLKRSHEQRQLHREAATRQMSDPDARRLISEKQRAAWADEQYKESRRKDSIKGGNRSAEVLREKLKDPAFKEKFDKRSCKPILYNGVRYESLKEAARILQMSPVTLRKKATYLPKGPAS